MSITARPTSPDLDIATSRTGFDTELGKSIRNTSESVRTSSNHTTVPRRSHCGTLLATSNEELGVIDDKVEDEWRLIM
ncbi:hypothetical protein FNV43_RR16927 [Rhamnella rubrinervis]|uniref:Uncharacterized protein n=1 Tax=Rhamnella rubrinervis TaxID=2594499 RepID=A0A8K0GZT1_9ROSA|nr:hypothetical protein FNV43_RR16927 [Rhamnella rubrinervis]